MAFSLTTTINTFFGSLIMVPETGVILNNQMNGQYPLALKDCLRLRVARYPSFLGLSYEALLCSFIMTVT